MKNQLRKMLQNRLIELSQQTSQTPKELQMSPREALEFEVKHHLMLAQEEGNPREIAEFKLALALLPEI